MVTINPISDATQYFDLLLLADPSPELVRAYIQDGYLYGATDGDSIVGVYVIVDHSGEGDGESGRDGVWELKNIAVDPAHHRKGIGRLLLDHAAKQARSMGAKALEVGTGDAGGGQLAFYESAGFQRTRVDKGFFLRNYDEPVMEEGRQHKDMIFLTKTLSGDNA